MNKKAFNLIYFGYTSFLFLLFVTLMVWLSYQAALGKLSYFQQNHTIYIQDFMQFYNGAKIALSDQRNQLYQEPTERISLFKIIYPLQLAPSSLPLAPIPYPPLVFFLIMPLTVLSVHQAHLLWDLWSILMTLSGLAYLLKDFSKYKPKEIWLFLCCVLACFPALVALYFGQAILFVLGAVAWYWWAWLKKCDLLAGFFLGLAIIKVQYLAYWLIPVLAQRRYKILLPFLCFVSLIFFATGIFLGWQNWIDYPKGLFIEEAIRKIAVVKMISIRGLLSQVMPSEEVVLFVAPLSILALMGLFWHWLRVKSADEIDLRLSIALTIFVAVITSPHCFFYDCLFLAIAAAVTLPLFNIQKIISGQAGPAISIYYGLFALYPVLTLVIAIFCDYMGINDVPFYALIDIVFFICLIRIYLRYKKNPDLLKNP